MPWKCVCVALLAIFASRAAQAQVTLDVTKVNCDQFVHHKISEPMEPHLRAVLASNDAEAVMLDFVQPLAA